MLANGDQPSVVRTGFLLLNGERDINKDAITMYLSKSKGHIFNLAPQTIFTGTKRRQDNIQGNNLKRRRKTQRGGKKPKNKRKTIKKGGQKSKTKKIEYYINHIYGKK